MGILRRSSIEETATVSFQVMQAGESRGVATVQLRHMVDTECGSHILRFTCALWVYNCTGLPLALQQSEMEDATREDDEVQGTLILTCGPSHSHKDHTAQVSMPALIWACMPFPDTMGKQKISFVTSAGF